MCLNTYRYIPTTGLFLVGLAMDCRGLGGGGGYGVGDCIMDLGMGQNCVVSLKSTLHRRTGSCYAQMLVHGGGEH